VITYDPAAYSHHHKQRDAKKEEEEGRNRTSQSSVEATAVKKAPPIISTGQTAKFHLAEIMIVFFSPRSIRPICKHAVIVGLLKILLAAQIDRKRISFAQKHATNEESKTKQMKTNWSRKICGQNKALAAKRNVANKTKKKKMSAKP
jgi:hypothetical protein